MSKLINRLSELIEQNKWKELEELLLNTEEEWVLEILDQKLKVSDGPRWVWGFLSALKCTTRESTALRIKVYENALKQARNEFGNERIAGEIVGALMIHIEPFPSHAIIGLITQYMEYIQEGKSLQGKWISLLPKLICSLTLKESINVDGKEMGGDDFRYQIVKTLCDMEWSVETTTGLLPIFKDLDLPKEELQDVIYKVESSLEKLEYQSVPPVVYHLILLGKTKVPARILQLIIEYFNKQEEKLAKEKESNDRDENSVEIDTEVIEYGNHNEFTQAQGTVILHITQQAQYYPSLVRDYLRFVRSSTWLPEILITPFNLALLLSLASIERYGDQIIESLKSCLLKYFRQEEKSKQSMWLREVWEMNCNITAAFKTTVDKCIMGWDQVSEGLVNLGFSLLESGNGPKGGTYVGQKAVTLASVVLPLILRKQPHLAKQILSKITVFIVSASSPLQYIDILAKLVKTLPFVLLEHCSLIQEQIEYLVILPPTAASYLLHTLLPLFKMNMSLKDALMMILRKMLFSKKMESRQVAVLGIIKFLRHFQVKGTLPSSQASTSFSSSLSTVSIANVHSVFNSATNEALCLELLGVLRRCFSQQQEVKSVLYGGLYDVCKDNPKLTVSILELLHQQSKQFLDLRPTTLNPVILKKVVNLQGNSVSIVEPVGELLSSLGSCKLYFEKRHEVLNEAEEVDSEENTVSVLNDICSLFDIVVEKLSGCELFDLGIDPQGDYSLSSTAGEKNVASVKVMMNVYDSLIEYTFSQGANVLEAKMKVVLQLFKSQKKLIDLLKEKSAKSGKKEGAKGKNRSPSKSPVVVKSNLSLSVVAEMLKVSYSKDDADNPNCVDLLKENHELQLYLLSFVEVTLTTFKEMTVSEKEKLLLHMKVIASVLLHECVENIASHDSSDKRIVQRIRQSLIILSTLITLFCKYYTKKLESIFREVTHQNDNKDVNSLLHKVYKKCQKMLLKILQHEDMSPLQRDAITITNIMSTVCQAMDPACEEITEVQNWILQLCKDQEGDSSVAESLMRLLFFLSDQIKVKHTLTRAISRELHHKLGDLEEGVEVEEVGNYKLVTETTSCYILPVLLTHIEETLGWMELVLNKMKACVATEAEYDANKIEKYLSTKCIVLIHTAHEIIQSALPLGNCMDNTLRVITKFYNILGLYVRYYLDLFKMRSSSQISEKFEKLVHTAGEMLTAPIYGTITYIEGVQRKDGAHISRTMKESKLIPSLIFSIEQFEKHLINLSRKSKVNLMQGMQLSTSRDFRILTSAMVEALQNEDEDGDNNDVDKVSDGDTNSGDETENPVNLRNNRESLSPGDTVEIHLSKDKSLSYIKGKGLGKSFKRKNTSDENTANAQNRQSQPPAKKSKPVKSKLGIAKKSNK